MDNQAEEERAQKRKNDRHKREMKNELFLDLQYEEDKREMERIENQYRNKYVDQAVLFFSTLALGYFVFFIANFIFNFFFGGALGILGVSVNFIYPLIHGAIWIMAVISAYRRRSVWDDLL